jgi:hypothetical protein
MRAMNRADVDRLGSASEVLGIDDGVTRTPTIIGREATAGPVDFNTDDSGPRPERLGRPPYFTPPWMPAGGGNDSGLSSWVAVIMNRAHSGTASSAA